MTGVGLTLNLNASGDDEKPLEGTVPKWHLGHRKSLDRWAELRNSHVHLAPGPGKRIVNRRCPPGSRPWISDWVKKVQGVP
jgi:hypothetical protein